MWCLLGALIGGLAGAVAVALAVGLGGSAGKQSFDAIVQRDTPQSQLGASFAKLESRFQLVWVFGALIPVVLPIPARLGFLIVAGTAGFAAVSYWLGKDPAPNTEVARRTAVAASARATQSVRDRTGRRPWRRAPASHDLPPESGEVPTAEHPGMASEFEPTIQMPAQPLSVTPSTQRRPALTDTQPVPIVKIDPELSDEEIDG